MLTAERLLASPRAALLVQKVQARLADEAQKRAAFLDWTGQERKAEFINGAVVRRQPLPMKHNRVAHHLWFLLEKFVFHADLGRVGGGGWLVSLTRNDYEPDLCFWRKEVEHEFTDDQTRFPAPDLVAEVLSDLTRGRDLGVKHDDYAAHGVREYWVLDPDTQTLRQFVLDGDEFALAMLSASGIVRSVAVEGFALDIPALFDEEAFWQAV